ncbi:MAG TPA: hypothetical protein VG937_22905 [Polyangiaceae bacterium]|nr:hypothetical protein [Polyangiaceae bacterium]
MRTARIGIQLLALLGSGCLGTLPRHNASGEPAAVFPAHVELEQLSARPVTPKVQFEQVDVERWEVSASTSASAAVAEPESHWERLLSERFSGSNRKAPGVRVTRELHCAAREVARFYTETGVYPAQGLRDFLALRCGSTLPRLSIATLHSAVPDQVPEAALEQQLETSAQKMIGELPLEGEAEVGIGFARGHSRGSLVVLAGEVKARIVGFSPIVTGVGVNLRGELTEQASFLFALANQGTLGAVPCETDRSVALPKFQVFCPFADADRNTRIEIAIRRPKRVMLETVAQAMLRRSENDGLAYQPAVYGNDTVAPDAHGFREALYAALNQARAAAGKPPLAVEAQQAASNERLAPRLFEGLLSGDPLVSDRIALGLMAGWQIGGVIRDGAFLAGTVEGERRPARFLASQLERPLGRFLLLDPALSKVAVGTTALEPNGAGAVITAYALFQESERQRDQTLLLNELTQSRAAHNKARPVLMQPSEALRSAMARIEKERISAYSALQDTLADLQSSEPLFGWAVETTDLRQVPWPDELLLPPQLYVEVGLTHYKPKGGAWGQFAVVFVVHQGVRQALIEPPPTPDRLARL